MTHGTEKGERKYKRPRGHVNEMTRGIGHKGKTILSSKSNSSCLAGLKGRGARF